NDAALERAIVDEPDYIHEVLRACPASAMLLPQFLPPFHGARFVDSPISTYDDEDLATLEHKQVSIDKIRATQWKVYSDATDYYLEAYRAGANVAPVLVAYDRQTGLYFVRDGHHRLYSHNRLHRGLVDVALSNKGIPNVRQTYAVKEMRVEPRQSR